MLEALKALHSDRRFLTQAISAGDSSRRWAKWAVGFSTHVLYAHISQADGAAAAPGIGVRIEMCGLSSLFFFPT